jgi:hypothetical protein
MTSGMPQTLWLGSVSTAADSADHRSLLQQVEPMAQHGGTAGACLRALCTHIGTAWLPASGVGIPQCDLLKTVCSPRGPISPTHLGGGHTRDRTATTKPPTQKGPERHLSALLATQAQQALGAIPNHTTKRNHTHCIPRVPQQQIAEDTEECLGPAPLLQVGAQAAACSKTFENPGNAT